MALAAPPLALNCAHFETSEAHWNFRPSELLKANPTYEHQTVVLKPKIKSVLGAYRTVWYAHIGPSSMHILDRLVWPQTTH